METANWSETGDENGKLGKIRLRTVWEWHAKGKQWGQGKTGEEQYRNGEARKNQRNQGETQ